MPKPHHKRPIVSQESLHVKKAEIKAPHQPPPSVHRHVHRPKAKPKHASHEASSTSYSQCINAIHCHAAFAVRRMVESSGSQHHLNLKSLTLAPHIEQKKAVHAVTCQVLKHLSTIKDVIARTSGMAQVTETIGSFNAYVLVYEVLMGQGLRRQRKGPAEKAVHAHKSALQMTLNDILKERKVSSADELIECSTIPVHPRWARVNTIKLQVPRALQLFSSPPSHWPLSHQQPLEPSVDSLLNDLLRFPPGTDLHDHPLVLSGELILQSKASCMPAHALNPCKGWHVLDCCAAPGNKTTHVSSLLMKKGGGRVLAFDRDSYRLTRLNENAQRAGAGPIIESRCQDFLSIEPLDPQFEMVKGIILDPSCSGSGTERSRTSVTRIDHLCMHLSGEEGSKMSEERIEELALFQESALRKTFLFPNVQKICYSTCSIYERENEQVVLNVLPQASELGFQLIDPFPSWPRRGHDLFDGASMLIRTDANEDETDGFFVAVFERKQCYRL
jgi:putative methyltransferase